MSPATYNRRLNVVNIVVSLVTVLILNIERMLWFHNKLRGAYFIFSALEN